MDYGVVWFKRDFRVVDHAALAAAARRGPVLCLCVVEPSLWAQPDAATQHYHFMLEGARELHAELRRLGGRLHLVVGDMPAVLDRLQALALSRQFTRKPATAPARDRAVALVSRTRRWHEFPQFGASRRLADRDRWQPAGGHVGDRRCHSPRPSSSLCRAGRARPAAASLGLPAVEPALRQRGGREAALACLHDFLDVRSGQYRGGISSPLSAPTACSRLSPYLAWGQLSLREVVQATRERIACLPEGDRRRAGLSAFVSRLYWHCHFIQKLESEPALEFENLHRGYDGLREHDWNPAHFEALVAGRTGWPLVMPGDDAGVRPAGSTRTRCWVGRRLPAVAALAAGGPVAGTAVPRLRAGHPLEPAADAVGHDRHQHHARL